MTNTHGLSRKEHLLLKIECGEPLTDEEKLWAYELLPYYQARLSSLGSITRDAVEKGDGAA